MVHALLEDLASKALRQAGDEITDAASMFWDEIRENPSTPDPPFSEEFRKDAFRVWGKVTEGHTGRRKGRGTRR